MTKFADYSKKYENMKMERRKCIAVDGGFLAAGF
jgi:hypothetical protein